MSEFTVTGRKKHSPEENIFGYAYKSQVERKAHSVEKQTWVCNGIQVTVAGIFCLLSSLCWSGRCDLEWGLSSWWTCRWIGWWSVVCVLSVCGEGRSLQLPCVSGTSAHVDPRPQCVAVWTCHSQVTTRLPLCAAFCQFIWRSVHAWILCASVIKL